MSLSPISFIASNFRDNKNEWLKAFEPGTTTPKSMALDAAGAVTVAKLQLNADGFIVTAGAALVIPYIDGAYDLWLFPTEALADANDTSNALRLADDILGVAGTGAKITPFTLAEAVANTSAIAGQIVQITDRADGQFTYKTGQTPNTFNIVAADASDLDLVLILKEGKIWPASWGVDITGDGTVSTGAMQHIATYTEANAIQTLEFEGDSKVTIDDEVQFTQPLTFNGNQVQIYQNTTLKKCLIFGASTSGAGNYRNRYNLNDIICGNVDRTETCIEYRNVNNSSITNVHAVSGLIAQHLRGCILSTWTNLYASTQINFPPHFFGSTGGAGGGIGEGILLESLEGLACNENTFIRPWGLDCQTTGMEVNGSNNTIISHDFEGISSPAAHLILNGKTNVLGGDIEGSGSGLTVNPNASFSHIVGLNNLSFASLTAGVMGVKLADSIIKFVVIDADTKNCIVEDIKINTGGSFVGIQAGTDNIVQNIRDINNFETTVPTASQTVFNVTNSYVPNTDQLTVRTNTIAGGDPSASLVDPSEYTETDANTVTFSPGRSVSEFIDIYTPLERGLNRSGTFTPILEFGGGSTGATWFAQTGTFIITPHGGGQCHFKLQLQINAKSSDTGVATVDLNDIPFAAKNDSIDTLIELKLSGVATGAGSYQSANLTFNTKVIKLQTISEAAGTVGNLDDTDFATTDIIWLTGSYFI